MLRLTKTASRLHHGGVIGVVLCGGPAGSPRRGRVGSHGVRVRFRHWA